MSTPEGRVKAKIKRELDVLKPLGLWYYMPVQSLYSKRGVPDFVCCVRGQFLTIEAKRPGGKPTPLQDKCMLDITLAGGCTLVIDGDDTLHTALLAIKALLV